MGWTRWKADPFRLTPETEIPAIRAGPNRRRCAQAGWPSPHHKPSGSPACYQWPGAALASRVISTCWRLVHRPGRSAHRHCDLFGFPLSWELDAPCCSIFLERQQHPRLGATSAASAIRSCSEAAGADRQPRAARALFDVRFFGTASCCCAAPSIDAVQAHLGERPGRATASPARCRASYGAGALLPPLQARRPALESSDRLAASRPVGPSRPGEHTPSATRLINAGSGLALDPHGWKCSQRPELCRSAWPAPPCVPHLPAYDAESRRWKKV